MMGQTVWQDWEVYVRVWNLSFSTLSRNPVLPAPLNGYRAKDPWGQEFMFLPYPPWLSEEGKKQARAFAQTQWLQWKAERTQRREEEEKDRRASEERLTAEREEKKRKAKEAAARKLAALAVRPPENPDPKENEPTHTGNRRYWPEFLVAPSCDRPPVASWDPANKTYTLPRGVRISSVQDGWEEESQAYESFALNARKKFRQAWCERKMEMEL